MVLLLITPGDFSAVKRMARRHLRIIHPRED
jgi:hypothetical protein